MDIASLGIKVTSQGVNEAEDGLEKMAAAGEKAAASQDRLSDANTRANKSANTAGLKAQRDELSKLLGQIDPVVAKLGQLDDQERRLSQFRAKGIIGDDDFKEYADKIEASRSELGRYADQAAKAGMSQRALAAASRGIPAQFTDIATSIASGQRPLTVLLQQGGQLKDMFGGVGPALKAVGGYALSLINPLTILTGVAAALGVAWNQGSDEAIAFNKALITTGNAAGITVGQLQNSAREISTFVGTQHEAASALAEVAGTGKFTSEQIALVGQAALSMSRLTGQATSETIRQFEQLKDEPVKAVLALNDAEHFLTTATYGRIKALQDSGREDEAATVAMKARADSLNDRAKDVQASAGIMVRAWNTVSNAAKGAWDAMLDVGRPDTADDQIKKIQERMAEVRDRSGPMYAGLTDRQQASILATYQRSLDQLMGKERQAESDARQKSIAAGAVQALADSDREADQYASREEKRTKALVAARAKAQEGMIKAFQAGDIKAAAQIQANQSIIEAGINEQFKDPKPKRETQAPDYYTEDRRQIEAEIAAEGKLQDQRDRATGALAAYKSGLADLLEARQADIDLQVQSYGLGQKEIARQQQLNQIYTESARKRIQLVHDMNTSTDQDTRDMYAQELAELDKYTQQRVAMETAGFKREDEAREDWRSGAKSAYADILDSSRDVAGQTHDLFVNAYDGMADSIAEFAVTGKASFKDFATSVLKDLARMEIRIAASQALQAIIGAFGGGGAGTSTYNSQGFVSHVDFNADGGVYASKSLSQYSGQVVNKPTPFMFAKGAALGVMGEAGPEAIMPLSRGSNGELGVTVHGGSAGMGGVNINVAVTVNTDGSSDVTASGDNTALGKQFGNTMADAARKVVQQELRPGGQIYNAMKR